MSDFINVIFPEMNKNLTLIENDQKSTEGYTVEKCKIKKTIHLSEQEYDEISDNLLEDREDLWEGIGGACEINEGAYKEYKALIAGFKFAGDLSYTITLSEDNKKLPPSSPNIDYSQHPHVKAFYAENFYTEVVEVTASNRDPFYVNTEGYEYARYVGRLQHNYNLNH